MTRRGFLGLLACACYIKSQPAVKPVIKLPVVTTQMLEDQMINIEEYLAKKISDKFARVENAAFINGNG